MAKVSGVVKEFGVVCLELVVEYSVLAGNDEQHGIEAVDVAAADGIAVELVVVFLVVAKILPLLA